MSRVLEELGQRSANAQGLRRPVTYGSAQELGDHRVYLLVHGQKALGILKVGKKRLFVASAAKTGFADVQDAFREIEPLCALDFYVHERCQRSGHGRRLFDAMLAQEGLEPARLAYDRPSQKLLEFLKKHYCLSNFLPQSNNFVVYDAYFEPSRPVDRSSASATSSGRDDRPGMRGASGDRHSGDHRLADADDRRSVDRPSRERLVPSEGVRPSADDRRSGDRPSRERPVQSEGARPSADDRFSGDRPSRERPLRSEGVRPSSSEERPQGREDRVSRPAHAKESTADGRPASGAAGRSSCRDVGSAGQRIRRADAAPRDLFERGEGYAAAAPPNYAMRSCRATALPHR